MFPYIKKVLGRTILLVLLAIPLGLLDGVVAYFTDLKKNNDSSKEKSGETLKVAFIQGFRNNGLNVSDKQANLFVSAYIDSYM